MSRPIPSPAALRILLVVPSPVGDAVLATPVLQALHAKYPLAKFDIAGDPRTIELFSRCPYRERLVTRDRQDGWRGRLGFIQELRKQEYDLVVDLRTTGLSLFLRARRRLTRLRNWRARGHAIERHLQVIRRAEDLAMTPQPRVWLSEADRSAARRLLGKLPGQNWLAISPGASEDEKKWPLRHWSELLAQAGGLCDGVVLLGNHLDIAACQELAAGLALPHINLAGRTQLLETAAVLAQVKLYVGNDSGLGHLAAAFGTPTLTLFGSTDSRRYHPWGTVAQWLISPTGMLADLSPAEVAAELEPLLPRPALRAA